MQIAVFGQCPSEAFLIHEIKGDKIKLGNYSKPLTAKHYYDYISESDIEIIKEDHEDYNALRDQLNDLIEKSK